MINPLSRSHSNPPRTIDIRVAAISRRIAASGPLAMVISDLAFGTSPRDDITMTASTTAARVAAAAGAL